jgi:CTP synthase
VPLLFAKQNLDQLIIKALHLKHVAPKPKLAKWENYVFKSKNPLATIPIGICGKYAKLRDSYKSVIESVHHAATHLGIKADLRWIESETVSCDCIKEKLQGLAGVIIPGGFGVRGIEGKIATIEYLRKNKIPFLGLCIGLQCAVIEYARSVCHLEGANSTEFNPKTKYPVIFYLPAQRSKRQKGGTMRLGKYPTTLKKDSLAYKCYNKSVIWERHRHRFEVNNRFVPILEKHGMIMSGYYAPEKLVEIIELKNHPFFLGTQYHPEFTSRPLRPNPLFLGFIKSALTFAQSNRLV